MPGLRFLIASLLLVGGCTGDDDGTTAPVDACRIVLSGAANGTFQCHAQAGFEVGKDRGEVGIVATTLPPGYTYVGAGLGFSGDVAVRTYEGATLEGGATAMASPNVYYQASHDEMVVGTVGDLVLLSRTPFGPPEDRTYLVHGRWSADLAPLDGGSGTIHLEATF